MDNPLKYFLTIQVSEKEVNSPDFDLANYLSRRIQKEWFKKAVEFVVKDNPTSETYVRHDGKRSATVVCEVTQKQMNNAIEEHFNH